MYADVHQVAGQRSRALDTYTPGFWLNGLCDLFKFQNYMTQPVSKPKSDHGVLRQHILH